MDFLTLCMLASEIMLVISAPVKACIDLETFMDFQCNNPNKPFSCPPSGKCYSFEEFCNSNREVESCFLGDISANDTAILEWCQKPDTALLHPKCKFACTSKFCKNNSGLSCDHIAQPTVSDVTCRTGQDYKSHDYQACGHTTSAYVICTWTFLALLILFMAEHVLCVFCLKFRQTVWSLLPRKDDQGTYTSVMVPLNPSDKQEQDIEKIQRQHLLAVSGDNMNGIVDPQRKDPQKDPPVTSRPSSASAREEIDIMASAMDPCDKQQQDIEEIQRELFLAGSSDNMNGIFDPQKKDPQKDLPVTSCPSTTAAREDIDIMASTMDLCDKQQQDIEKIQRELFLAGSSDNMNGIVDPQRKDPQKDPPVASCPSSAAAREDIDAKVLAMDPCGATPRTSLID